MARDLTQMVPNTESDLLFHHSLRFILFGALTGRRKSPNNDADLLYAGRMFHDVGLTTAYQNSPLRFDVVGANAACDFLRGYRISERQRSSRMRSRCTPHPAFPRTSGRGSP
jgi:hypothetical protein